MAMKIRLHTDTPGSCNAAVSNDSQAVTNASSLLDSLSKADCRSARLGKSVSGSSNKYSLPLKKERVYQ